jgi:hypothetical protein
MSASATGAIATAAAASAVPKAKSFICSLSVRRHQIISALGRCKNDYTNPETAFSNFVQWDYWPASTGMPGTGVPVVTGRDAAVDLIRSSLTNANSAHHVHTPLIELNADGADVVWATQDRLMWEGGPALIGNGHYR